MEHTYDQPELEKVSDPEVVRILRLILERQEQGLARIASVEERLVRAFPGGDVEGHRRAHEAMIERTLELKRLRIAIQEKTIAGLVWSALFVVGLALWNYALTVIRGG